MQRARVVRGLIIVGLAVLYFGRLFQLWGGAFWTAGIGDWQDPYFVNYVLEHWLYALRTLSDPSSPPMYYPAEHTLGYSHGLILYAPFYIAGRALLHPLQAHNMTLVLVILAGTCCLYVVFRRFLRLSFLEAFLLTACFATSPNVIDGPASVWSQRLSVFLVPPIVLVALLAVHAPGGRRRMLLAFTAGSLATLLLTQDFYSALFAYLFVVVASAPFLVAAAPLVPSAVRRVWNAAPRMWRGYSPGERIALAFAVLAGGWTLAIALTGGGSLNVLGITIRSTNWRRPAVIAAVASLAFLSLRRWAFVGFVRNHAALVSASVGIVAGMALFLWIYLPAYREFPGFAAGEYRQFLKPQDPDALRHPFAFAREYQGFESTRPFALVLLLWILLSLPWKEVPIRTRTVAVWFAVVSLVVFLSPFLFDGFSVWGVLFERLPGFGAIRDPRRIIYLYDLAVVFGAAYLSSRLHPRSAPRVLIALAVLVLLVAEPNRLVFGFDRPNTQFERWVDAPIDVDPSCRSFFVTAASPEYTARSPEHWSLYSIDAMFISLKYSIPTFHGYSAWTPTHWQVWHPEDDRFADGLAGWIAAHDLAGVCQLSLDRHTMTPYRP